MSKRRLKRSDWLAHTVNDNGFTTGAEVGCLNGQTTRFVLKHCPDLQRLYAVDLWDRLPDELLTDDWNRVYRKSTTVGWRHIRKEFEDAIKPYMDRVEMLRGLSWLMAEMVDDESLDFVFIDADHQYESVIKDIRAWTPKLRPGGMISGHDANLIGVNQAITELIPEWQPAGIDRVWYATREEVHV